MSGKLNRKKNKGGRGSQPYVTNWEFHVIEYDEYMLLLGFLFQAVK